MKLSMFFLALLGSTVYAGPGSIQGSIDDAKMCGSHLYQVSCNFNAQTNRRTLLRGLQGPPGPPGNVNVQDVLNGCSFTEDGTNVDSSLLTQTPMENCRVTLQNNGNGNNNNNKLHIYITMLSVTKGPSATITLKILENNTNTGNPQQNSYNEFNDVSITWKC